jgi:hypothetical protein
MYSSIGMLALAATLLAPSLPTSDGLVWHTDYAKAKQACQTSSKPMAVVVGMGVGGYNKLVKEGTLSEEAKSLLEKDYIFATSTPVHPKGKSWRAIWR